MQSNLTEFETEPASRSTLLNVLCILSFVGSTGAMLSNLWVYTTGARTAKMVSYAPTTEASDSIRRKDSIVYKVGEKKREVLGEKIMNSFSKMFTADTIRKNAIGGAISAAFTLLGAILMWRLKRMGYYFHIIGVIIGIIIPLYLYGNNLLAVGISVFTSFFGLVFISLYSLIFKSLRG
ncbi:MAG: hypothetical protein ABIO76_09120 [Ginsengibacter sp.]